MEAQASAKASDLGEELFLSELAGGGLRVRLGPYHAHIQSDVHSINKALYRLYADYPLIPHDEVFSFHVRVQRRIALGWKRPLRVRFTVDGLAPHADMPLDHALPVLEWGINLVIAMRSHAYLVLHSAVLERNGDALLLPAAPGFGKTTLCAALCHRGWRLLSDEFGLVRPGTDLFVPVPRPMALKNESIEVIRAFAPNAFIGPPTKNTRKGTVAHVKPPSDSVRLQQVPAPARHILFPRWRDGARLTLEPMPPADGFMMLAMNAFNYEFLGEAGFRTVSAVTKRAVFHRLVYSDLDGAIASIDQLVGRRE